MNNTSQLKCKEQANHKVYHMVFCSNVHYNLDIRISLHRMQDRLKLPRSEVYNTEKRRLQKQSILDDAGDP